jgi:ABC-2 type transport system permease protein
MSNAGIIRNMHNFGQMARFILRRDRVYLPLWIIGLVVLLVFFAPLLPGFVADGPSKAVLLEMLKNPAMIAMMGVSYGDGPGAMYALFMLVWASLGVAAFNIMFVVRHTRKDEEEGRAEMLAALPVGRGANLLAVLIVAFAADVVIALMSMLLIPAFQVEGLDMQGSAVLAFTTCAVGLVFASVAALLAQLFSTSKSTNILAFVALGGLYMLRAAGDMDLDYEALALVSPIGLAERCEAWVGNLAWPAIVLALEAVVLSALAFAVAALRDSGAGVFPGRRGRAHASSLLAGEWGLAWRLNRSLCIGWTVVMLLLGMSYGSILGDISSFMENNELYSMIIGSGQSSQAELIETFVSFLLLLMAIVAAAPVCMLVFKLRSEERRGRMEQVLGKSVNRCRLMAGYLCLAALLSVVLLAATPLGMYAAAAAMMDSPPALSMMMLASMNFLPAVLAVAGLSALLTGLLGRLSSLTWLLLVYCFFIAYIGNIIAASTDGAVRDAFDVCMKISPFNLLPLWPSSEVDLALTAGMSVVALALAVIGVAAYRRRDIKG